MKTMKCNQLAGPESCEVELSAETFDEMVKASQEHGMEMVEQGDEVHKQVMEEMQAKMSDPEAVKEWEEVEMPKMREIFNGLLWTN